MPFSWVFLVSWLCTHHKYVEAHECHRKYEVGPCVTGVLLRTYEMFLTELLCCWARLREMCFIGFSSSFSQPATVSLSTYCVCLQVLDTTKIEMQSLCFSTEACRVQNVRRNFRRKYLSIKKISFALVFEIPILQHWTVMWCQSQPHTKDDPQSGRYSFILQEEHVLLWLCSSRSGVAVCHNSSFTPRLLLPRPPICFFSWNQRHKDTKTHPA